MRVAVGTGVEDRGRARRAHNQLLDIDQRKKLRRYFLWLDGLTKQARDYERVTSQLENNTFRDAKFTHALFRRERLYLQSEDDVAAFLARHDLPTEIVFKQGLAGNGLPKL